MMKIMGVDYGDARTGIAISDLMCTIVGSTCVVPSRNTEKAIADIVKLCTDNMVGEIVVGLPKNMDGTEGERSEVVRAFARLLSEYTDIPLDFYDERMTTMVAYRFLGETGTFGKKRKNAVDTLSAEIILQNYIDRERLAKK
jgi:putative Holliday junction resolvase